MTKKVKIFRWICVLGALPAAYYALSASIFYAWLNAYDPEKYPAEEVAFQAYSYFALTVTLVILFLYCVISLIKERNKNRKEKENAI